MNNRILATLFALAIALFIGVAPVKAEAAEVECQHVHDANCGYVECVCKSKSAHTKAVAAGTCAGEYQVGVACKFAEYGGKCIDLDHTCKCDACYAPLHDLKLVSKQDATCTEDGLDEHYECANGCGNWFADAKGKVQVTRADVTIKAEGHKSEWITTSETHTKVCSVCGFVNHGLQEHSFAKAVDNGDGTHTKVCTTCKYELVENHSDENENCSCDDCDAALEHKFDEWYQGETGHWKICTNENCDAENGFAAHDYAYTADEGKFTHSQKCKICGKVKETQACFDDDGDHMCDGCGDYILHNWDSPSMEVVHKTATCTEDGIWLHYQCKVCGLRMKKDGTILDETTMVNPASGHTEATKWSHNTEGHWKQCVKNGVDQGHKATEVFEHEMEWVDGGSAGHYQQCKVCKRVTETVEHTYVRTSLGNGKHETKCSTCGYVMGIFDCEDSATDEDCVCDGCGGIVAHTNKSGMKYVAAKAATCEEAGHTDYYECTFCGGTFLSDGSEWDPYLEPLGHDWVPIGKTLSGKHQMKCSNCDVYSGPMDHYSEDGDCYCDVAGCNELVHSHKLVFVAQVDPACGKDGAEAYYKYEGCGKMFDLNQNPITAPVVIKALDHDNSGEWISTGENHVKKCVNCGEVLETAAHTDSNYDNRCDVCNIELSLEYVEQVDPTCTNVGYKGYWISKVTGRKYADENGNEYITSVEKIPAAGHSWTSSDGNYHVCGVCGQRKAHTASGSRGCFCAECNLPMPGHELEAVDAIAATCEKPGQQAYVKCSCGKLYDVLTGEEIAAPVAIKATGHNLGTELFEDTVSGDHYKVCTNDGCDKEFHEEHAPVLEDPLKGNYHQWVCECGYVKTAVHYDDDGDNKCDECDHDMANTSVNVQQHDSVTVITGNKETINNQKSWWQNWLDNLLPGTSGGTTSSKTTTSGNTTASSGNASASGSSTTTSGSNASASGSSTTNSNGSASTSGSSTGTSSGSTGVINEFIQWLTQLFNVWLQG